MRLTYKQRLFVSHYLGESAGNATDAARRAGYRWPDKQGDQLLGKAWIRQRIDARLAEAALSADEALARLSEQATASLEDFLTIDADGIAVFDLVKARRLGSLHLARKIKQTKAGLEVELYDAQKALEIIGRFHNLWREREQGPACVPYVDILADESDVEPMRPEQTDPIVPGYSTHDNEND